VNPVSAMSQERLHRSAFCTHYTLAQNTQVSVENSYTAIMRTQSLEMPQTSNVTIRGSSTQTDRFWQYSSNWTDCIAWLALALWDTRRYIHIHIPIITWSVATQTHSWTLIPFNWPQWKSLLLEKIQTAAIIDWRKYYTVSCTGYFSKGFITLLVCYVATEYQMTLLHQW